MTVDLFLNQKKKEIANTYNLASAGYDLAPLKFFRECAASLVQFLQISPGQTILDVGTGTGEAAILAARDCQPGGQVIGIDLAVDMLSTAARKIKASGLTNLRLQPGDAEKLAFPDNTFDLVISNAAVFFLTDMTAGLQEWQRTIKTGGQVGISGFNRTAFQPLSDHFERMLRRYGVTFAVPKRPFSWQRLDDPEQYRALLTGAGYHSVEVETQQAGYYLTTVEDWWQIIWNSGFRGPLAQLTTPQLEQFKLEYLAEIAALQSPQGIWLDVPVILARGGRP